MEKLADNLQKLGEDDLLQVVEMVHNNKTPDTYTKNDVERKSPTEYRSTFRASSLLIVDYHSIFSSSFFSLLPAANKRETLTNSFDFHRHKPTEGEFHVDLYTLPDSLIRMLWDFSQEKLGTWTHHYTQTHTEKERERERERNLNITPYHATIDDDDDDDDIVRTTYSSLSKSPKFLAP